MCNEILLDIRKNIGIFYLYFIYKFYNIKLFYDKQFRVYVMEIYIFILLKKKYIYLNIKIISLLLLINLYIQYNIYKLYKL